MKNFIFKLQILQTVIRILNLLSAIAGDCTHFDEKVITISVFFSKIVLRYSINSNTLLKSHKYLLFIRQQ